MSATLTLTARNQIEELARIAEQVAEFMESQRCDADARFTIQFALEELFSNIVLYAFEDNRDSHRINIRLDHEAGELALTLEDDGRTFDPLSAPVPDTSLPVDQRPIGGLGLFITQRLASSIDYRRVDGKNRVTVRFIAHRDTKRT
jgi:anti-sigma regulatory factor (Ser/Thr protein kinase)